MAEVIDVDRGVGPQLFEAIKVGDAAEVAALLAREPGLVNARGDGGLTPVMLATYCGRRDLAELLMARGAELDVFAAAALGDLGRLEALLVADPALAAAHSADGWTPLHLAAHFGQLHAARSLLSGGADPRARSTNATTNTPLHAALAGRHADLVALLLDAGADANAKQHGGFTALQAAAQHGELRLVELLLGRGADVTAETDDGRAALTMAEDGGHTEVADLLRRHAA